MTVAIPPRPSPSFLHQFLAFCRELKTTGIRVTLSQEIDACHSLEFIDILNHNDFYHCLKTNLVSRNEDVPVFNSTFAKYWGFARKDGQPREHDAGGIGGRTPSEKGRKPSQITIPDLAEGEGKTEADTAETSVYSPSESLQEKDFSAFDDHDIEIIRKALAAIMRRMKIRESYRKRTARKARFFDLRRTMRKNIRQGGELVSLAWRAEKIEKTRIVLLCDVSGSMERYSRFLLQFLYGLQKSIYNLETFVFSTRLSRLTPLFQRQMFEKALERISHTVLDWSGGTRIGECLSRFNQYYSSSLLYRKTIVMIISDGWDQGDEELLQKEMNRLRKKAGHIIWLNPLLGYPEYQPLCKGMKAALPFLDQFLPLHNVASLIRLGHVLCQIP